LGIFRKPVERIEVPLKSDKNDRDSREDRRTFFIISPSIILRMTNASDEICRENQNKYFMFLFNKIMPFMS